MDLSDGFEKASNAVTIVAGCILSAVLIKVYLIPPHLAPPAAAVIGTGANLSSRVQGVNWAESRRTVVLVLSTQCHFCSDSAPFYRRLAQAARNKVKVVALLPQTAAQARQYLRGEGVAVDEVRQVSLESLGVRGTPTLLLVDGAGVVQEQWVGRLQSNQEAQVLSALNGSSGG
jgi:thiol-disulfide isomerase/thioredoxin